MYERIKKLFFNYALSRVQEGRKVSGNPPYSRVGILFDASNQEQSKLVLRYADKLSHSYSMVTLLGYIDNKVEEGHEEKFNFYSKVDLNWYEMPRQESISAFTDQPLDIFINLMSSSYNHQEFILKQVTSVITVGPHDHKFPYDIEIDADTGNIKEYLIHMMTILMQLGVMKQKIFG